MDGGDAGVGTTLVCPGGLRRDFVVVVATTGFGIEMSVAPNTSSVVGPGDLLVLFAASPRTEGVAVAGQVMRRGGVPFPSTRVMMVLGTVVSSITISSTSVAASSWFSLSCAELAE